MLYTTIKRRGKQPNCEVHILGNGVIELRNFYVNMEPGTHVRYTPKQQMTMEEMLLHTNSLADNLKEEGLLQPNYKYTIDKLHGNE